MKVIAPILLLLISSQAMAQDGSAIGSTSLTTIQVRVSIPPRFSARIDEQTRAACIQTNYGGQIQAETNSGQQLPNCAIGALRISSSAAANLLLIRPE